MPSCVFVNTFYPAFLAACYADGELVRRSYAEQLAFLLAQNFGDSDFYSEGLRAAGFDASDLVVNCAPLQLAWAREQGVAATSAAELVVAQIQAAEPDAVYFQDLNNTPAALLDAIRPHTQLICGQIATPVTSAVPFERYDVVVSSFPHYVERLRAAGVTAYYQPLAFHPRILASVGERDYADRDVPLSFVGGISGLHVEGNVLLERLSANVGLELWGYGVDSVPPDAAIARQHRGEAWGSDMFALLGRSRITINRHGEVAERFANNMRLFEATGCGALLITDHKDNLDELFSVGEEIVAYRSAEECESLVRYYVDHPDEAAAIAKAGQARTLRDHSYSDRMAQTAEVMTRQLRRRGPRQAPPAIASVSRGHRAVRRDDIRPEHLEAWKDPSIPAVQRALVESELDAMYAGRVSPVFQLLADCLRPHLLPGEGLIEVGCASGYYYEVLEYLLGQRIDYVGVDYAEGLIELARSLYPRARFEVADGAALPFPDAHFAVAVSGGVLLHVLRYADHIREAARVAARAVVLARTPVCRRGPTRHLVKEAYGVETVELVFAEDELLEICQGAGLIARQAHVYASDAAADIHHVTYLFEKGPQA